MIPDWYPDLPAIYDIEKSYAENFKHGPFFSGKIPERPPSSKLIDFFGHQVRSPIGVPAGPLLSSKWIKLAGELGFDIPTYKTIRSFAHPGHPLPNVVYVEQTGPHMARQIDDSPLNLSDLTITNYFGMPSQSPEFLAEDIEKANRSLGKGQVMIVSIVGTPHRDVSFLEDFARTALFAKDAGAKIIEANFSCPNVEKAEGCLYMSPDTVFEYAKCIVEAIKPIPLLIKVGLFPEPDLMRSALLAAARAGVQGISAVNSIGMQVIKKEHSTSHSGVCGGAIRPQALHFIHKAAELIEKEKLDLKLIGCGGIMRPDHFDDFLKAGADIAMSATGMMWDPLLALRYHEHHR